MNLQELAKQKRKSSISSTTTNFVPKFSSIPHSPSIVSPLNKSTNILIPTKNISSPSLNIKNSLPKQRIISNTYASNLPFKKPSKTSPNIPKMLPYRSKSNDTRAQNSPFLKNSLLSAPSEFKEIEKHKLRALIRRFHDSYDEVTKSENDLRLLIETNGGLPLPDNEDESKKIRSLIWKVLLRIKSIDSDEYLKSLKACPSKSFSKIKDDVFRTLATDPKFKKAVPDKVLIRILNAIVCCGESDSRFPPRYVQGMNALLAPFSFVLNEPSAFFAFKQFLLAHCPSYVRPFLPGVIAGAHLVDECLAELDPELFVHLHLNGAKGVIYAYSSVMTLSAGVPPLDQLLRLWDYYLASGVHLNIVCIVAQVQSIRDLLLTSNRPNEILRVLPRLNASSIIRRSRKLYKELPKRVRDLLKGHTIDIDLATSISNKSPCLNLTSSFLVSNVCKNDILGYKSLSLNTPNTSLNSTQANNNESSHEFLPTNKPKRRKMPTNLGLGIKPNSPASSLIKNNNAPSVRNFNPNQHNRVRNDLQNWVSLEKD
ncbi:putative mitotic check point protein BUB2 [Smittium culicis]|uniref:Putative mitotic check point protein BUB2 n=1 Tax=Smittium culicis TaxID=133412 RepID=A0A1R1YM64_9FUNG|nr:putative mitotic check point protein BUB2 [Smittium culicis]